ncbi:hypothetical protein Hypma_009273 [Hypsizygus marmoreus]|uniref:ubiquitinyl hydrolase 1 n=1 Tax=Hypsizygus marmoreus TaxID=39966 RepID=A0A369JSP6_HYPMA|nr:hypothetical protein Hypma_009273 [Hypsizygus marmoreus]
MDDETLRYIINHLFLPVRLPDKDDHTIEKDLAICDVVIDKAEEFAKLFGTDFSDRWRPITKMLKDLRSLQSSSAWEEKAVLHAVTGLKPGDILVLPIRAQNACVILRKTEETMVYEAFEINPPNAEVMGTTGRLVCSYPGPAVTIVNETALELPFQTELVSFLAKMDVDLLPDSMPTTVKAGSTVVETRDTADPHYITQLLTAILRGLPGSEIAQVKRIDKRIRDDIIWHDSEKPWRRSSLWLVLRVALQTTLQGFTLPEGSHCDAYKAFMVFVMGNIMCLPECTKLSTDLLHCMQAKVSRRLHKLREEIPQVVVGGVTLAVRKIMTILADRWSIEQSAQARPKGWAPNQLNMKSDIALSLLKSKEYIIQRLNQDSHPQSISTFQPSQHPRLIGAHAFDPDELLAALTHDPYVALIDTEHAVRQDMDRWVVDHLNDPSACIILARCIKVYCSTARRLYVGNPEDESTMLLTIFQLWAALDKLTIAVHPLLSDYSPEVPEGLLESLLLRKTSSIERFLFIQQYISQRHRCTKFGSIFEDKVTTASFSVRHFDTSSELIALRRKIEADARRDRDAKSAELKKAKAKYDSLMEQALSQDHQFHSYYNRYGCIRCQLEHEAENMKINVHEWPLPEDGLLAKGLVFELQCPAAFQAWRTTTYEILHDVCQPSQAPVVRPVLLGDYPGLRPYIRKLSRITYASSTKSFSSSHYASMSIASATSSRICVNNGLTFHLFDEEKSTWAAGLLTGCSVVDLCTFKIPSSSPYGMLQYAVTGTNQTSNRVIAEQSDVPPELSLHEHNAFGTLRSGPRLQWLNISRELRTRTMSFAHTEVQLLVLQAAFQVGPVLQSVNGLEWHAILQNPTFGTTLLSEIEDFVGSIEDNWLHVTTLQTFILLITRLLASVEDQDVIHNALHHLKRCREIAFKWLQQVTVSLRDTEDDAAISDLQHRICMVAATCRSTYDVEPQYLQKVLASHDDVEVFVQCAICLHDNVPPTNPPNDLKRLLSRDRRLSQRVAFTVWTRVEQSQTGLDCAIASIWAAYRRGSPWKQLLKPNNRWITTTATAEPTTSASSTVHLNLFDGALLINGKPLGRLPSEIVTNPTYTRILGQKILDIIPSDLPNMDFATRGDISLSGFQLHFQLQAGGNLIIQAKQGSELYELIPNYHLTDDFPTFLVERYAHWLHLSPLQSNITSTIEFRPMESRWAPSEESWRIDFNSSGMSSLHVGNLRFLVDIRSPTFKMVSSVLGPLESPRYLHVSFSTGSSNLLVELPRYKLSFFMNASLELESNNLREMVIDTHNPSGTMVGLSSQLVLKSINSAKEELPRSRCIIIPFGDIVCQPTRHHVNLHVDLGQSPSMRYFKYDIDTTLGCLVGTTLLSELYKILLHASTSFPLPDPLTGRTGTEEALAELGSAKCLSFQTLGSDEFGLLSNIAWLSPKRAWYPEHLKVMETVLWSEVGPHAQHWGYDIHVRTILRYHAELSIFEKNKKPWMDDAHAIISSDEHLRIRASSRNFYLYPPEFALEPSPEHDGVYSSPSCNASQRSGTSLKRDATTLAADVSAMVQRWPRRLHTTQDLWTTLQSFTGPLLNGKPTQSSLSYQSKLFKPQFCDIWIPFYDQCRKTQRDIDKKFALTFSLPAMIYGSPQYLHLIPTLLAFATVPQFTSISPPSWTIYDLSTGIMPNETVLLQHAVNSALPLPSSPDPQESDSTFHERREFHRLAVDRQARVIAQMLSSQWPCEKPSFPSNVEFPLIDVESVELRRQLTDAFTSWYRNRCLHQHVRQVQKMLPYHLSRPTVSRVRHRTPTFGEIIAQRDSDSVAQPPSPLRLGNKSSIRLGHLLRDFSLRHSGLHRRYGRALESSRESYDRGKLELTVGGSMPYSIEELAHNRGLCHDYVTALLTSIERALGPTGAIEQALSGQWPRITIRFLLGLLSPNSRCKLTEPWRAQITRVAQSLVRLQHMNRILFYAKSGCLEECTIELSNDRFEEDSAFIEYPEWLLIQINGDFLVRPLQTLVAREMMSPTSNKNTVLQLNMGEGKSSVIVPLISSCLADGERLVRVVVLKPLAQQMFQLLVLRLSGLANRRIFSVSYTHLDVYKRQG